MFCVVVLSRCRATWDCGASGFRIIVAAVAVLLCVVVMSRDLGLWLKFHIIIAAIAVLLCCVVVQLWDVDCGGNSA